MKTVIQIPPSIQAFANFASFPATGTENVIYIDKALNELHYWNGTIYVKLGG